METDNHKKSLFSHIIKLLYFLVISLVCVIVIFLLYYIITSQIHANDENYKPNISIYTIVSPSMTPVINVYDVVLNVKVDNPSDIHIGDIITYKSAAANSEGMTITHRVVDINKTPNGLYEFTTQGDNNSEPDVAEVTFDKIIGKEILIIPYLGRIQFLIANQKGWLFLLLIPVSIYLVVEIIKLVDLFNLRKKVNKVVGTTEDNFIIKKREEKLREEARKERLKEELANIETKKDSKLKSVYEPEGFLEKYTETVVSVKENKYANTIKPTKINRISFPVDIENNQVPQKVKKKNAIKKVEKKSNESKKIINEKIEILDTDELTSKIKEYDNKIEKLDKMIKNIEDNESSSNKETYNPEEDKYLSGSKIKVINIEEAKTKKKAVHTVQNEMPTQILDYEGLKRFEELISLSDEPLPENKNEYIERPVSEDINILRTNMLSQSTNNLIEEKENKDDSHKLNNKTSKEVLNLNPKTIKKVNRPNKKNKNTKTKKTEISLSINPDTIKKVERPPVKKRITQTKTKENTNNNTKKPLIVIKKTK